MEAPPIETMDALQRYFDDIVRKGRSRHANVVCIQALTDLAGLFTENCRLTLIVRAIDDPEGDRVITKDDLQEVRKAIERSIERETQQVSQ